MNSFNLEISNHHFPQNQVWDSRIHAFFRRYLFKKKNWWCDWSFLTLRERSWQTYSLH
jgi:hypothetical protein